ncbi:AAA family ATPase [Nonomuraea typhae]|uniref:AAA family ATPase n=1 Tax=Nonomuraea typhae TaxID=2603600 RepID=UPI0015E1EF74|nr:AAA family ATPase [Nonomuraea typhae]
MTFEIRVLGRTTVLVDGLPQNVPGKTARVLTLLIAAGRPVSRETLTDALWETGKAPASEGIAPLVSRFRSVLARGGLTITSRRGTNEYILTGDATAVVDAHRFERGVKEGLRLLGSGQDEAALARLTAAAGEWHGRPYALWEDGPPEACARHARRLETLRADLVRNLAQTALRLGRYDEVAALLSGPVGEGHGEVSAVWLLRFMRMLREQGGAAAERALNLRAAEVRDEAVDRAFTLLMLHEHGVDVHRPPDGTRAEVRGPEVPRDLVGREEHLNTLLALRANLPGLLAVRGVPGVGKSRLLSELAARSADSRPRTVVVSCQDSGELQPWRSLTGMLYARLQRDLATGVNPLGRADHKTLVDFVSAMPGSPAPPGLEDFRQRLLSLLSGLLRWASRGGGLVVAFDNAELFSRAACELLAEVRRGLGEAAVGFVLAGRPEGPWREMPAAPVTLVSLTTDHVRAWLGEVWERPPSEREVAKAFQLTGGLPQRLCEVRAADGELSVLPGLGHRPGPLLPWLAAAAITCGGGEIDPALLADMLDLDSAEADRQQAAAVTLAAVEAHSGVRFRHELRREEVLAALEEDPALARRLHRRAFEVLGERLRTAEQVTADLPVRMAMHARAARPAVSDEQVATACLTAARAELSAFGLGSARSWAEYGLRLPSGPVTRFGLLMTLGEARIAGSDMHTAGVHYREAYDAAADLPRLRAVAAIQLARRWTDPGQVDEQLLGLLEDALAALSGDDEEEAADLRVQLSAHLAHKSTMAVGEGPVGEGGQALTHRGPELARRALAELRADCPPEVRCEVLNECRMGMYDFAPPAELLGISRALHDAGIRAGSSYFHSEALVALAVDHLRLGDVHKAAALVDRHRAQIAHHPRVLGDWLQTAFDTLLDLWRGRFDEAAARLFGEQERSVKDLEEARVLPAGTLRMTWDAQVFWLLFERGELEVLMRSDLAGRVEQHGYWPIWRAALAMALAQTGHPGEAWDTLTELAAHSDRFAAFPPHGWRAPALALVAETCSLLDEAGAGGRELTALAAHVSKLLVPHVREVALAGWPAVLMGPAARYGAAAATVAGQTDLALRRLRVAEGLVTGSRTQLARVRYDRARALMLRGERAEAAELVEQVLETAIGKGMTSLAQRARALIG